MQKFKNTKKGFSLIELLVVMVIALIISAGIITFFMASYKNFDKVIKINKGLSSVFNAMEILETDIRKAGYGFNSSATLSDYFQWDNSTHTLDLKFVDYQQDNCTNKTWADGTSCNYEISYKWEDDNLKRKVNSGSFVGMFDTNLVKVENFEAPLKNCTVSITLSADIKGKKYTYKSYVKIPNCE